MLRRGRWATGVLATVLVLVGAGPASPAPAPSFPERIALPDGFSPEGIAVASGGRFFTGSVATGAIYRGDLRTGGGSVIVPPRPGAIAAGIKADHRGRIFVAGALSGQAYVYDASSGALLAAYDLAPPGAGFVNDVVVTQDAAFLTDSFIPVLYRIPIGRGGELGAAELLPLSGDVQYTLEPLPFNLNGIDATPDGKTLIVVQTNTGQLFTVDPATGVTHEIPVSGGDLAFGDGILLDGKTLYVMLNFPQLIARVELAPDLSAGVVSELLGHPGFDIPTTIAEFGSRLYAVNARFTTPPTPATPYWVTQVRKP